MNSISQDLNAGDFKPLRLLHHSQIPSGQPLKILLHPPLETRIAAPTKQPTVLGVTWPLFFSTTGSQQGAAPACWGEGGGGGGQCSQCVSTPLNHLMWSVLVSVALGDA